MNSKVRLASLCFAFVLAANATGPAKLEPVFKGEEWGKKTIHFDETKNRFSDSKTSTAYEFALDGSANIQTEVMINGKKQTHWFRNSFYQGMPYILKTPERDFLVLAGTKINCCEGSEGNQNYFIEIYTPRMKSVCKTVVDEVKDISKEFEAALKTLPSRVSFNKKMDSCEFK